MTRIARHLVLRSAAVLWTMLALGCGEVAVSSNSLQHGDAGPSPPGARSGQDAGEATMADKDGGSTRPPARAPLDAAVSAANDAGDADPPPKSSPTDAGDLAPEDADTPDAAFEEDASHAACVEGEAYCEEATPFICDDEGVFQPEPACEGPAFICEDGACVQTDLTTLGLAQATGTQRELAARHFYATRVTTQDAATLRELRIRAHRAGGFVRLALYADRVDGGVSRPGTFIADGIERLQITGGEQLTTPRGWQELTAETTYWVVAVTSSTASIVYAASDAAGRVVSAPYPAGFSFAGSFPDELPTADIGEEAGLRLSLYLGVQTLDP
jgi:hypothetical protein